MLQLLQNLGDGQTTLAEVPSPGPTEDKLLIRTTRTLISAGTERMLVDFGKAGWLGKARQQPEKVRAVIDKVRSEGAFATWRAVKSKLDRPIPLGYCQVGRVIAAGDAEYGESFAAGDRVVSNGPHAEVVSVPTGLCAKIPDSVSDDAASFTPLAAIALEGINLLGIQAGDRVIVTGLGLIGQLAVRILRAMGCQVLGFDPSSERRAGASRHGAEIAVSDVDPVSAALAWTNGRGVAGVLITASSPSNDIVSHAARSCRYRGKVVLVGVVGLSLNRADFYRNEVSLQVSCSYGRCDLQLAHSAQANFRQVLAWIAKGVLPVEDLITDRYDFTDAPAAYVKLTDRSALGILLRYDYTQESHASEPRSAVDVLARTVECNRAGLKGMSPQVGLIGAGNFASRTLLPALAGLNSPPKLVTIASSQGADALLTAQRFGASRASTDANVVLGDKAVEAVFITTRHSSHAGQAISALSAGKHVWVEKPLALSIPEIESVTLAARSNSKILMVGFNRRFAPMAAAMREAIGGKAGPCTISITVNAGRLPPDHWTLDASVGGGRIVGEGCHFIDLVRYLVGAPILDVKCTRRDVDGQDGGCFEIRFEEDSRAVIDYRTDLPPHIPKETVDVSGPGYSARISNWSSLRSEGLDGLTAGRFWNREPRKGHSEAIAAFLAAVGSGAAPIPLDEVLEVSRWAVKMQAMSVGEKQSLVPPQSESFRSNHNPS